MELPPETRCLICECPTQDHVPLRYVFKAWFWHRFHRGVERLLDCSLGRIPDTTEIDW